MRLRISQEELGGRAGLHRTYISDVERGARNVSLESIERLAQALELSVSALFHRAGRATATMQIIEILLVEDNEKDIELTQRAFRKARIRNTLHIARDGEEALDFLFATGPWDSRVGEPLPGVILLDLALPKIDGLEVLRRIKADARTQAIPVIALTASNQDRDIAACRRLGVESYIVKPVGMQNITDVMPNFQFDWALLERSGSKPPS